MSYVVLIYSITWFITNIRNSQDNYEIDNRISGKLAGFVDLTFVISTYMIRIKSEVYGQLWVSDSKQKWW
jgi:hypothetical protein